MKRRAILLLLLIVVAGCAGDETLRFGAVLPLTGDFDIYGQSVKNGVELAFDELRANPAFPYAIDLMVADTGSDPTRAGELAEQQYDAGALAIIGGVTTAEALQMVSVADKNDRLLISPSASSPELTGISKNFYRIFPSDFVEGTKMGNFAAQGLKAETAVILAKEEAYAKGVQEVFQAEFERHGGEVLEVVEFPEGISDFSGLVARVITLNPSAVYLAAYAHEIGSMVESLRAQRFEGRILTTHAFASPEVMAERAAQGVFLTQPFFDTSSDEPSIQRFVAAYEERFGKRPDLYAAHGYDSVMVLAKGLEEPLRTPSDFWRRMRAIQAYPGVTGTIQFNEKGDVGKFPRVYVVDKGNLRDYETEVAAERQRLLEKLRKLRDEQSQAGTDG